MSVERNVELLKANTPYEIRRKGRMADSEHEEFPKQDKADRLDVSEVALKPGSYALKPCKETVAIPVGDGDFEEERESFGYEKKDIVHVRERRKYTQHSSKWTVHHIYMTELAIHFRRVGLRFKGMVQSLDYHARPPICQGVRQTQMG